MTPAAAKVIGSGISMQSFARNLAGETGRNVVDKTGLAGSYDLELEIHAGSVWPTQRRPVALHRDPGAASGLKLDSQRAPVEVLVIDKLEKPMPD